MSSTSGLLPESSGSPRALLASTTRFSTRVPVRLGPNRAPPEGNRKGKLANKAMVTLDEFTPEMLESERAALLAEKQTLLETVNDRHDNLVREMFHMEQFTLMVGYDPIEAKHDSTPVFTEYKSRFDLLNAAPTTGAARTTRRRLNERRQILSIPSVSASPLSLPKLKGKSKAHTTGEAVEAITIPKTNQKRRGLKLQDVVVDGEAAGAEEVIAKNSDEVSGTAKASESLETIFVTRKPPRRLSDSVHTTVPINCVVPPEESIPFNEGRARTRKRQREQSPPALSLSIPPSPAKVLDLGSAHSTGALKENVIHRDPLLEDSISVTLARRSGRLKESPATKPLPKLSKIKVRPLASDKIVHFDNQSTPLKTAVEPEPYKAIKRIKLIVRRPPPRLTNPKQRPPQPKYDSNINHFLTSYINIFEDDTDAATLQQEALEEAKVREQVAQFHRDGRFIPGTNTLFGTEPDESEYIPPKRESSDHWDAVIDEVVKRGKTRPRKGLARHVAGMVASRVQAHFESLELKRAKAREAEEKRLRNLARTTMKMVISEWKKAVFHIREKQRLEEEAEERRLGHAHLDAILDQSGQLLETQHGDLARGDTYRSRSRSGSIPDIDEDDEENEEDHSGSSEEDEDGGDKMQNGGSQMAIESDEERDESGDEGSSMLLGSVSSEVATPATTTSGPMDEDEDFRPATITLTKGDIAIDDDLDMVSDGSSDPGLGDLYLFGPEFSPAHLSSSPDIIVEVVRNTGTEQPISEPEPISEQSRERSTSIQPTAAAAITDISCPVVLDTEVIVHSNAPCDFTKQPQDIGSEDHQETLLETVDFDENAGPPEQEEPEADQTNVQNGAVVDEASRPHGESGILDEEVYEDGNEETSAEDDIQIPDYLRPYAVAPVHWDPDTKVTPPLLLRGVLRPYQQSGLEWLASLHVNKLNGILADEMGLGKTIQTIALLAHLACDRGIWGPHLIVVPTSVLLNWEMEFKKFLPGFRILSYHGSTKRRKELRQGWNDKHHFNVCITSYALASRDAHIFKRKAWYYLILDEAHMIKNFKSQRWNILLMFRSYRRLLLTGTPLQNNLTELWALLQFLMSGANFANLKEFGDWFSNPLEKAVEMGNILDDETMQRVSKLHTVLRPYLLRRLKRDVEKELPSKFEHLTLCPLSKRQRFLYDEFMSRAQTRDALESGIYQKIANILMQLRKVCNHPDLFEVRPIVTSFAMDRSAIADFEIKELLIRRKLLSNKEEAVDLDVVGLRFIDQQNIPLLTAVETRLLDATTRLPHFSETAGQPPPKDTRTIAGFCEYSAYLRRAKDIARWAHNGYLNKLRCSRVPIYSEECLSVVARMVSPIIPFSHLDSSITYMDNVDLVNKAVKSYTQRAYEMSGLIHAFAFITPPAIAHDLPKFALAGCQDVVLQQSHEFSEVLHQPSVKLQIAFPEPSLLQYDCGKLQKLATLLREKKAGGHRCLIFTQMTRILDILEIFLNFHGYLYLRLDGATKIEDRQYITERFNADSRVFCFIASSRSGGVGINLTGADTVIFYDSDFNPQMDRQCEDRAHRIGQIRDVHIYRFVSQYTVEEAMLRKANQKRTLDDLVIQKGEFDWRSLFNDESALTKALGEYEDTEDQIAAAIALREETSLVGADEDDFGGADIDGGVGINKGHGPNLNGTVGLDEDGADYDAGEDDEQDEGGTVVDYMVAVVDKDWEYFCDWRL